MIAALRTHARGRALMVGALGLAAIFARVRAEPPPPRTVEGVASALGRAAQGTVKPDDFLWEERGGFFHDAFVGRRVLFLASPGDGAAGPRDLYRARVRLTRAGRPISVSDVRNLSRTPLGDDRDLTGSGHHVAFATATADGVQGVTLLDLDGDGEAPAGWAARARAAADRWLATGSVAGLGRTEIALSQPPGEVKLEVTPSALVLALGSEAVPAAYDPSKGELVTGPKNVFGASAQRLPAAQRPAGELVAELLAEALGDGAARAAEALFAKAPRFAPRPPDAAPEGLRVGADYPSEGGWPPSPIAPPITPPFDGEGFWHAAPAMQGPQQQVAAPPILEAVVRPDPAHAAAIVRLIAIDTRRLDVRAAPGVASPEPSMGPRGSGLLPAGDLAAVFTLGPPPSARPLGFFGEGRLLSPLAAGAPSLAVRPDGRAALGPWPEDASRDAFVSVAQAPDALGAMPAFAPSNAAASTSRAALCRTVAGYLVYAFAASSSAQSLKAGLALAGCASAMHLGAEPSPLGFAYLRAGDQGLVATPASSAMSLPVDRPGGPWQVPIAALSARDPLPAPVAGKRPEWRPDAGAQPAPAWLPGIFSFETEQLGAKVKVTAFMPERVSFRLAVGTDEGTSSKSGRPGPSVEERGKALAALGISVSKRGARRGLWVGGAEVMRSSSGAVWLSFNGARAAISRPGDAAPSTGDATELPLLADDFKLLPAAREVGAQRPRSALCVLPDGTVTMAHARFDTDEATVEALLEVGCERVVGLDRGAHDGVFVHRAGGEQAPEGSYEATVVYVLSEAGQGTVRGF